MTDDGPQLNSKATRARARTIEQRKAAQAAKKLQDTWVDDGALVHPKALARKTNSLYTIELVPDIRGFRRQVLIRVEHRPYARKPWNSPAFQPEVTAGSAKPSNTHREWDLSWTVRDALQRLPLYVVSMIYTILKDVDRTPYLRSPK